MKKIILGLLVSALVLPALSFAQTTPQPPAAWVAFQKEENVKRAAFFKEMRADRDAFLAANPDVKEYFEQMRAAAKAKFATMRVARQNKI